MICYIKLHNVAARAATTRLPISRLSQIHWVWVHNKVRQIQHQFVFYSETSAKWLQLRLICSFNTTASVV
jgi:hypothetical protein